MAKRFPVLLHLARGVLGFAALWAALRFMPHEPAYAVALLVVALALLRGCPMCWLSTLMGKLLGRQGTPNCSDDTCEAGKEAASSPR